MEEKFRAVVENIFSNWTALQLAIEHDMACSNSQQTLNDSIEYIVQYCLRNVDINDIQEALEDIMDQEFDTVCEDDSPLEISNLLYKFAQLLKVGNLPQFELDFQSLPIGKFKQQNAMKVTEVQGCDFEQTSRVNKDTTSVPMEEESEWTEVNYKKRN